MTSELRIALEKTSLFIFLGLLAYMPLHILLSTWIGSATGTLEAAKVAKDGVLVLGFLLTLGLSVSQAWFKPLLKDKLVWLIVAYAGLTLLMALIKPTDQDAEALGVVYNTRFLLFFLYGLLLARLFEARALRIISIKIVLISASIVATFGVIQYLFLPNDALIHIGYSRDNGVLPAFFIDNKPDLERIMSTLRDPNSLGSYLIIIGMLLIAAFQFVKKQSSRMLLGGILGLTVLSLWFTFSRSAIIGFILAAGTLLLASNTTFKLQLHKHTKVIFAASFALVIVLAGGLFIAKDTYLVKNVVFHADERTTLEDPNQLRLRFFRESVEAIADNPEGTGPGTAGLASIRNNTQGTVLNENYYLQIASEVGVIGLLLFLAILIVVAKRLYQARHNLLALALLASFTGLAFTNLLVHIWSNEAVAYTWWGLAALALAQQTRVKVKN